VIHTIFAIRLKQEAIKQLTDKEIEDFFKGNAALIGRKGSVRDIDAIQNASFMPYNSFFELEEHELAYSNSDAFHIGHALLWLLACDLVIYFMTGEGDLIGKGAFGVVYKAKHKDKGVVAVKMATTDQKATFQTILLELKVILYLGYHPNIVEFIGAVTGEIRSRKSP
jgi:hypothetical protein